MIRILLVDDHAVVRAGYRRFIDAEPDLHVVAEAASAREAYAIASEQPIDVIVLDLAMPDGSGLDLIRRLLSRQAGVRILVFSMHDSSSFVTQAMRSGALGFVTKASEPAEMLNAIREVGAGRRFLSGNVAQMLAREALDGDSVLSRLTPREFEVFRLLVGGQSPASIANQLHLSAKTVLNHLSMVRQKLEVESDLDLLRLAVRHRLAEL